MYHNLHNAEPGEGYRLRFKEELIMNTKYGEFCNGDLKWFPESESDMPFAKYKDCTVFTYRVPSHIEPIYEGTTVYDL